MSQAPETFEHFLKRLKTDTDLLATLQLEHRHILSILNDTALILRYMAVMGNSDMREAIAELMRRKKQLEYIFDRLRKE